MFFSEMKIIASYIKAQVYSAAENKSSKPRFMYWNKVFEQQFLESKNVATTQPSDFQFTTNESFDLLYFLQCSGEFLVEWNKITPQIHIRKFEEQMFWG